MSNLQVRSISDQEEWQNIVDSLEYNTFLHSNGWVDFNEAYGHKTFKLGLFLTDETGLNSSEKPLSIAMVLKISAKRGTFLFIPHGPQFSVNSTSFSNPQNINSESDFSENNFVSKSDQINAWKKELILLGKQEKCDFIRISPILENTTQNYELFAKAGFKNSPIHMHAELTTVVDLTPSNKEILKNMRKTMRQMIKKSDQLLQSGEVKIEIVSEIDEAMHEVYKSTTKRGGFVPFSLKYLQVEYDSFAKHDKAIMCKIVHQNEVLSWGMFIFSGKHAFYHQGANILNKQVPASYMSHWFGMQQAKERGCVSYDFWGVGPKEKENHPWANISSFKRGFGGNDFELVHAQDYPLSLKYWLTFVVEWLRAKKRGF